MQSSQPPSALGKHELCSIKTPFQPELQEKYSVLGTTQSMGFESISSSSVFERYNSDIVYRYRVPDSSMLRPPSKCLNPNAMAATQVLHGAIESDSGGTLSSGHSPEATQPWPDTDSYTQGSLIEPLGVTQENQIRSLPIKLYIYMTAPTRSQLLATRILPVNLQSLILLSALPSLTFCMGQNLKDPPNLIMAEVVVIGKAVIMC